MPSKLEYGNGSVEYTCELTGVRIVPVIPIGGLALLSPSGIAFLSDLGFPYARALEITHHEGLLIEITTEFYNPDIFWFHFMHCAENMH